MIGASTMESAIRIQLTHIIVVEDQGLNTWILWVDASDDLSAVDIESPDVVIKSIFERPCCYIRAF